MCPTKFDIFLIFLNIFKALSRSATREATHILSVLYQISRSLLLVANRICTKYCKVPKHYDQDCLKFFFLLSTLPMMIQISGKSTHLAQKCYFYQKTTNEQS